MLRTWSLRRRVLLASGVALVIALAAGVVGFRMALDRILTITTAAAAKAQADQLSAVVAAGEYSAAAAVRALPSQGSLIQLIDASGTVMATSDPSVTAPGTTLRPAVGQTVTTAVPRIGEEIEPFVMVVEGIRDSDGQTYALLVAVPQDTQIRTVDVSTLLLAGLSTVLALAVLLLIDRILHSALRPVSRIRQQVAAISSAGSTDRVTVPPTDDEVAALAVTMNEMLDRLSRADATTRRFVSDASHELRSPLATIRTTLETSTSREDADLLTGETLRLERLVDDLLTLARADDHGLRLRRDPIDLDDIVDSEARRLRTLGADLVRGDLVGARVRGDGHRIGQILRNLTDNALRHTTGGIRLVMERREGAAVIHVDNEGEPVAAEQREAVFERFARLDDARDRGAGGSGLGLAIARTLAEAHGGRLAAGESPDGWCRFSLTLPVPDDPELFSVGSGDAAHDDR